MTHPDDSPLQRAIAQLDAFRAELGDAAIDAAIAALRRPLAPVPESRLRQVSVLFADVADSTALLGRVSAEDAMALIGQALQQLADAVQRWGGQVLRFTGDGLKAAFGTQGLREDDAERAVRAGLQMLRDMAAHAERVQRELGVQGFGVRVGIHTGPVLLGGGPEAERTAMGQAVHLAARMEQSAPVGRLRISDSTWAEVRGLFVVQAQPPLFVKGHAEPLTTWLVERAASGPELSVQRGLDGVDTPMLGRDAELAQLLQLHAHCVAGRCLGVALVEAEAGVGKTRLRQELLRTLGLAEGDAGLLQARAHPSGSWQPYGLLRQLLARWLDIHDDLPGEAARQRLLDGLAPWLGDTAAVRAPRIGQLIGLDFSQHPAVQALGASALRTAAFDALRQALLAHAAHTPLLLVLDDLHWADDASLGFVQTLLQATDQPCMLLLLARPSLHERGVALLPPAELPQRQLRLQPLAAAAGQALVQALLQPLPEPPAALQQLLLDRAEGNPFFLQALVRMLIDDGVIDASSRPWRLHAERLATLRVPATLVGVLQARLDALPAADRLALQQASIVGAVFWDAALAAVDPQAPAALPPLQRRALIQARASSAFAHTDEHAFAHALLHDVTYGTVLKPARRAGHAAVARWLDERVNERAAEFLAITAEHHERAGDSAQALVYWDRAQSDAYKRYANDAALHAVERALAQPALTEPRWRFHLMSIQHELLVRLGRHAQTVQVAGQMSAWAETCDDNAMRADVLSARMLEADHEGRIDEARQMAEQALRLAADADASGAAAAALAHGELAWLATLRHEPDTVAEHVAAGLVHAHIAAKVERRQMGYDGYQHQLHTIAIESLLIQERFVDALAAIEQALADIGGRVQDRYNLLLRRARALRQVGDLAAALAAARQALDVAERTGMPRLRVGAMVQVAEVASWQDDFESAQACLDRAEPDLAALPFGFERASHSEVRAGLALRRADPAAARLALQQTLDHYTRLEQPTHSAWAQAELARLDLLDGQADIARAAVDQVLAGAEADPRPNRRGLGPPTLCACQAVLAALQDARAAAVRSDLLARLDEQLAALPDASARDRLLSAVPHWRAVQALR